MNNYIINENMLKEVLIGSRLFRNKSGILMASIDYDECKKLVSLTSRYLLSSKWELNAVLNLHNVIVDISDICKQFNLKEEKIVDDSCNLILEEEFINYMMTK